MELQPEWNEFLSALKRHGVRFLLVGAHAVAAHGRPRFTQDLDVLVDPTPANAGRPKDLLDLALLDELKLGRRTHRGPTSRPRKAAVRKKSK